MTTVAAPPLRVVLADDSAESRELLRAMLRSITGVEVIGVAGDGRQAVDLLQTAGADVVFLDIAMPVMDGLEAAAAIRAHYPDVTIIVYSAYDRIAMGLTAMAAGADEYFEKAVTVEQLLDQLRGVFPDRGLALRPPDGRPGSLPRQGSNEGTTDAERAAATDQALRADDYQAVVESLPDPVFVLAARRDARGALVDLEYRYVNAAALRLYGMPWEQVVGHGQLELFPSMRENGLREKYLAVLASGEPASIEVPSFDENGVRGGFSLSVARFGDGVIITARDITAQLRAAQELAVSERRMRQAFESMLDGVVILSPVRDEQNVVIDFRFDFINDAGCRLTRMPRERHVGHRMRDVLPGFRKSGLFDDFVRVVQTGQPLQKRSYLYEDVFGGTQVLSRVWDLSVVAFGDGIMDTFREVSDQVAVEDERKKSHERLRTAVQSLSEGFFLTEANRDQDGRVVDLEYVIVNAAGCAMTHHTETEIVGHRYREIWPATPADVFDHYCSVADTGVPYSTTAQCAAADGINATYEVSVTKVNHGCAFVLSDVTDRLWQEQQLADAHAATLQWAEQLERSNQELQVFASAISHDLREPLRTVAGFVNLIRDRYAADLPEQARDLFGYVLSGTQRMDQRTTAMLDYARAGASAAPPQPVDTTEVARAAAADVAAVLEDCGARLRIGDLPVVQADPVQLQRVLQNLLGNAAIYRDPTRPLCIDIDAHRLDGHWRFTVADNGAGVPAAVRDSIFHMFRRGPASDGQDGHGMGLAICRRIIESYGGRIWVQDNPGGGSRFCFTLPEATPS